MNKVKTTERLTKKERSFICNVIKLRQFLNL